ncbi:arabinogalactan endo-1,4-beta-galactosidase, partial [Kineococcus glutinatus]|uniref:glycoside hydrolase family 53 protein n=1 Tax=Kineococcus glutinatus TaxID=1070872 RepID=UPI0031EE72FF
LQLEAAGVRFSDGGRVRPVERILRSHGANWVRLRTWVNPPAGYSDLAATTELARRAKRAGMQVLLDLHYSDFWADPAHQSTPAAWAGQDLPTLAATVRRYTRDTVTALERAGARVDMVQVGNEVTAGMLWPLGQVYRTATPDWAGFTTLLKAGIAGVRDASGRGGRIPVMVHVDRGGDNGGSRWFFDHVLAEGVRFDVIGQSYYPFWHGSLQDLRANLTDIAARYDKDVVLVETAYPWTLENGDHLENLIRDVSQLPDAGTYPATPQGQAAYFETVRQVLLDVPGGRGLGFFAWEPEWVPGVGWAPGEGNPNDNLTMFDRSGAALPSLAAFRAGR